jgi:hypothetical protein
VKNGKIGVCAWCVFVGAFMKMTAAPMENGMTAGIYYFIIAVYIVYHNVFGRGSQPPYKTYIYYSAKALSSGGVDRGTRYGTVSVFRQPTRCKRERNTSGVYN